MSSEWDNFSAEVDGVDELARVKRDRDRLARELNAVKHRHQDYIDAIRDAAETAIGRISIPPVRSPLRNRGVGGRQEEVAVALLSDIQSGKVTPDYNSEVANERVMRYAEKIVDLTEIQRKHHPVRKLVMAWLGDMIEGVDIFPGQSYLIDSTLYDQLYNTTPSILANMVRSLIPHFDSVEVYAVDGNHGRIGRKGQFGPMDNADRFLYRNVQMLLRDEPKFQLRMTDPIGERNWYHIMRIGNYSAMLLHGDQIRGSMGYPWYGLGKKVHAWASGGLGPEESFRDVMHGHYHQLARVPLNHRTVWANGSTESTNTFASETLAAQSEPMQWLLYVDPEKGRVTASYGVELK